MNNLYVTHVSTWTHFSAETGLAYINTSTDKIESAYALPNVSTEYGSMIRMNNDFSKIYVESEYSDISLYFDRECSVAFDILHHEKAVLRLPGEEALAEETFDGREHNTTLGSMGTGEPAGQVNIDALQKCFINISFK